MQVGICPFLIQPGRLQPGGVAVGTAEQLTHHTTPFLTHTSAYLPHFWLSDNLNCGICVQWEPDLKVRIAIAYRLILHLLLMNLRDGVEDGTFSTHPCIHLIL